MSTILVDQGDRQSTQPSVCPPTSPPAADEQSAPVTEFVKEDIDEQLTGASDAWDDMFAIPLQTSAAPESLPMTAETAPFAGLGFSALASGLGVGLALDEQFHDLLSSILDPADVIPIDGLVVDGSAPKDVTPALPASAFEVDCMPTIFSRSQGVSSIVPEVEDPAKICDIDARIVSYPLVAPLNDQQQDEASESSAPDFALPEEQPHLESDILVLEQGLSQVDTRTESGVPETVVRQPQRPLEPSLPNWVPPSSIEPPIPLPPAEASSLSASPSIPQDETTHRIAEEHAELEDVEDPSSASESEAEDGSPSPPTPLVRRRSGGLHDRIICSYERRTYYGSRPCSEQWQAFIAASPLRANRRPFWGATNKCPSSLSSLIACSVCPRLFPSALSLN